MKILKALIAGIILAGVFYLGFGYGEIKTSDYSARLNKLSKTVNLTLFWETLDDLKSSYVDRQDINSQKVLYGAISGMVKSLGDPYTTFFDPHDAKRFLAEVRGKFEGVGMEISIKNNQLTVIAPLKGTPAFAAGIKAGDKIIKINNKSTTGMTLEEAVNLIRGPKGTEVTLSVFRSGWEKIKEIKIIRNVIKVPSIKWELKDGNIAYIEIYTFSQTADADFRKAALEIIKSPAKKIILDLRGNPGGFLEVSQNIAGWFLKRGKIVTIEAFGNGKEKIYRAPGPSRLLSYPLVVLINEGSASASEILAASLRDNRGIKLIGEKSFGKGSVQIVKRLSDNSALKVTVAKWLTPKKAAINKIGLEPDIKVKMTADDYKKGKDPQLEKALEVIKKIK